MIESQSVEFNPPRTVGVLVHVILISGLGALVVLLFNLSSITELGPLFLAYLLAALFFAVPVPFLLYSLISLLRSAYIIDRDGVRLQWGFRLEEIPIDEVIWVGLAEDLPQKIKLPRFRFPGAVLGVRDQGENGETEFMASETDALVLIRARERVYAVSPRDRNTFLRTFQEMIEMGSLSPIPKYSAYPNFLFIDISRSSTARLFIITSFVLSLGLFVWVGLAVPTTPTVSLGFSASGIPLPPVPSVQLFLLPVLNILLQAAALVFSIFFYRQPQGKVAAYFLWTSSAIMSIFFSGAIYFILQAS